jgi:uncharacterized protein
MIQLSSHALGVVLPVKARPGAKHDAIAGEHDGHLKVSVRQVPEHGKANRAVAEVLCKSLGLRAAQLALLSGETSSTKRFLVRDVSLAELADRLAAATATPPTKKKR